EAVADDDDGLTLVGTTAHLLKQAVRLMGREACGRLVEHENQLGALLVLQRAGDGHEGAIGGAQSRNGLAWVSVNLVLGEKLGDPATQGLPIDSTGGRARVASVEGKVLLDRQFCEKAEILVDEPKSGFLRIRSGVPAKRVVLAKNGEVAAVGFM